MSNDPVIRPEHGFPIRDKQMVQTYREIESYAKHDYPCVFLGDSGAGKEYAARYYYEIWRKQENGTGPFVAINCAMLTPKLAQSELFGYKKGAFTGAERDKPGLFQMAQHGVLFLDEIADLPTEVQPMLLRAINDELSEAMPLGGMTAYSTKDVRVLAATSLPFSDLRKELQYRLGAQISIPNLKQRPKDCEAAARYYIRKAMIKRKDRLELYQSFFPEDFDQFRDKVDCENYDKDKEKVYRQDSRWKELINSLFQTLAPQLNRIQWDGNFRSLRQVIESSIICTDDLNSVEAFIQEADRLFRHRAGNHSERIMPSTALPSRPSGHRDTMMYQEEFHQVDKILGHIPDDDKFAWAQFLWELKHKPGKMFKRRDLERRFGIDESQRKTLQNRLTAFVEAGIFIRLKGFNYKLDISEELRLSRQPSLFTFSIPTPDAASPVETEETEQILKILSQGNHLFLSCHDKTLVHSVLNQIEAALSTNRSLHYYPCQKSSLEEWADALIHIVETKEISTTFSCHVKTDLSLSQQLLMLTGYIEQLLQEQTVPLFILDDIDRVQDPESVKALGYMLHHWPFIQFFLTGTKMPTAFDLSDCHILEHRLRS